MIAHRLRQALETVRPPTPVETIDAMSLRVHPASASLSIGRTLAATLGQLVLPTASNMLLVPDRRSSGSSNPTVKIAVAQLLARNGMMALGVPNHAERHSIKQSESLAQASATTLTRIPGTGWCRVEYGDRSQVLETADLPCELFRGHTIIALSSPINAGCVALWADYAHPNTALRARVAANAVFELSLAIDAHYVIVIRVGNTWIAATCRPAIVAELIARGIQQLQARQRGYEMAGPWEDSAVQHLFELTPPELRVTDLVLDVSLEDNRNEALARMLSELLGWRLAIRNGGGHTSGE